MTVFSYIAINDEGKEVRGSIESADIDSAKAAMSDLHLEVVDVREATRKNSPEEKQSDAPPLSTFAFEGKDAAGNTRRGTVQAASKRAAFESLLKDQNLTLNMLAPMGTLPTYNDRELMDWQKKDITPPSLSNATEETTVAPPKKIGFTTVPDTAASQPQVAQPDQPSESRYHTLVKTITLYAGWLLAWYGLFVALGYYTTTRTLPWDVPFVQAFYVSPLIFSFTIAIYLLLLTIAVHKILRGGWMSGIFLTCISCAGFVGLRMLL